MTGKAAAGTAGTLLRRKMIDRMRIAGLAESTRTRTTCIGEIEHLARHYKASPADLDADQLRAWVLSGIERGLKTTSLNKDRRGAQGTARLLPRPDAFEPTEVEAVPDLAGPGSVFVDIGTNCGFYSLRVARALADTGGSSRSNLTRDYVVGLLGETRISDRGTIAAEIRTLPEIAATEKPERIDAVKVDVEGFEDRVLDPFPGQAPEALLPRLIVAEHAWSGSWKTGWTAHAMTLGYRERTRTRQGNLIPARP